MPSSFRVSTAARFCVDRHLLVQHLEPRLVAGLDAHVDEEQAGVAQLAEQLGLDIFGAAADLPDRRSGESALVQPLDELGRPAPPARCPRAESRRPGTGRRGRRDSDAGAQHLLDDLRRLADADDFARRRAVEGVDRAERAASGTAAARQQRQGRKPADLLGLVGPIREGQRVEILRPAARGSDLDHLAVASDRRARGSRASPRPPSGARPVRAASPRPRSGRRCRSPGNCGSSSSWQRLG